MPAKLTSRNALIVVDMQRDFCPGGSLPVQECAGPVRVLNEWVQAAVESGAAVIASRDWHPVGHISFQERGGEWPPHCVQNTSGAEFHPDLNLPEGVQVVDKGSLPDRDSYSAFQSTDLAEQLRQRDIERIWIGGVALEVCVQTTALDARRAGFEVHVILPATSAIDDEGGRRAVAEMRKAGIVIEE